MVFGLVLACRKWRSLYPTMKILSSNILGAVSTVAGERKGSSGPDVQKVLAVSVGVVDKVKLEKTTRWECFFTLPEGSSPSIYAVAIKASPAMI